MYDMYDENQLLSLVKQRLSDYRFNHSVCVAQKAVALAQKHGADAKKAYIAGILHDITKEDDLLSQKKEIEKAQMTMTSLEIANEKVYHQMSGMAFIKNNLAITDEDILYAVRYHTTGRANMTLLEMIIYLADFTSADRNYPDVDIMRAKTDQSLFDGMLYSLSYTIKDLASKNRQIHPHTLECYNWVIDNIKGD